LPWVPLVAETKGCSSLFKRRSRNQNNKVALIQIAVGDSVWLFRTCESWIKNKVQTERGRGLIYAP